VREVRHELSRVAIPEKGAREPINQRLESYHRALEQLQSRALLEPLPAAPRRAYDGQLVMCDGVNWDGAGTGQAAVMYYHAGQWWPLLDTHHLNWAAPSGEENPHPQYFHKVLDPAGVSMSVVMVPGPVPGGVVSGWTDYVVSPYGLAADTVLGRISFDGTAETNGVYVFSVYLDIAGNNKGEYHFDFFDHLGAPQGLDFRLAFANSQSDGAISWSHVGYINMASPGWLELRCTLASSAYTIRRGRFSAHRISPAFVGLQAASSGVRV